MILVDRVIMPTEYLFTAHALLRMKKRGVSKEDVEDAVQYSDLTLRKQGKYYARKNTGRGTAEVVYEKTENYIKVITVYWV